jgi:hypothetical protein
MASKGYTIVETSKLSASYNSALINVELQANGALENGRLVAIENGKVRYAKPTDSKVFLHASVEKMYDTTLTLADFRAEDADFVRIMGLQALDEYKTSAFTGTLVKGDKVTVASDDSGKLVKVATPTGSEVFLAEVLEVSKFGVVASSLGFDNSQSVVVVRVIKA